MNNRRHRRKLGQNYLVDPVILFEIERAVNPQEKNIFLEIGPGTGALTKYLANKGAEITGIDIDPKNIQILKSKFSELNYKFIQGDILSESLEFLTSKKHRIVGNLPYNISTQIILKLIHYFEYIDDMHFLVQKEVAQRVCSNGGEKDWGRLAIKIKPFFQSSILFDVPPEAFDIKPKVISSFIRLTPLKESMIDLSKFKAFSAFIDQAFSNKRKNIKNNLKKFSSDLSNTNVNPLSRPEELSIEEFICIFNTMSIANY